MEQNSTLKKEVSTCERKLLTRNDRIQNLEAALSQSEERLAKKDQKYEAHVQALQIKLQEGRSMRRWLEHGLESDEADLEQLN